ncbi:MAG TPA: hypothetical protein VE963_07115, partial [Reyranella sp.]|nr:hypothetical protein [Reyranella sp.]
MPARRIAEGINQEWPHGCRDRGIDRRAGVVIEIDRCHAQNLRQGQSEREKGFHWRRLPHCSAAPRLSDNATIIERQAAPIP